MPAEAWVALILGIATIIGSIFAFAWYLGGKLSRQDTEMDSMKEAIQKTEKTTEKMGVVLTQFVADRAERVALERRVATLERWYDELRRGVGRIEPPRQRLDPQG